MEQLCVLPLESAKQLLAPTRRQKTRHGHIFPLVLGSNLFLVIIFRFSESIDEKTAETLHDSFPLNQQIVYCRYFFSNLHDKNSNLNKPV